MRYRIPSGPKNEDPGPLLGNLLIDKVFRTEVIHSLDLKSEGFDFCLEVTALVAFQRVPIMEVSTTYTPRSTAEEKKIRWLGGDHNLG